ncbi:hypothetical protein GH714_012779 [Hevea brasiliensis]|uniref:TF-B3 domain-containing protein n=1 Tax=Hevea brasiliensis TaxID=3981 RepID=A0A6A6LRG3_HEVBR|nr:hypothetical protein GH714_012779 [Hevea brasiliensis]
MGSFKQVDDATFGKKLEEIIEAAEDDSKALHMLAEIVIEDFHVKKAKNASLEGNKSCNFGYPFGVLIPKRKRTPRVEVAVGKIDDTMEACPTFLKQTDLPSELRRKIEEMDGTELELVIMKQLSQTDLSKNHNRISMPVKQIINEFLSMEEKEKLNHRDGKRLKGIDVMVVGPSESDDVTKMCLKKWDMNSSSSYALVSGWYSLVKANKELLKENAIAQFWSFRIKGELWFRLVIARERVQDNVDNSIEGSGDGDRASNNGELMSTSNSSSITYQQQD